MRRVLGIALVATMAVVAIAPAAEAKAKPKKPQVVVLTTAQLTPAMLALEDMPLGWTGGPDQVTPPQPDVPSTQPGAPSTPCVNIGTFDASRRPTAVAGSTFSQSPGRGPSITESGFVLSDVSAAQTFVNSVKIGVAGCVGTPNMVGTVSNEIAVFSFPKLGDQSTTYSNTGKYQSQGQTKIAGTIATVYVRRANNVIVVSRVGSATAGNSSTTDAAQLLTYSKTALGKLDDALAAARRVGRRVRRSARLPSD